MPASQHSLRAVSAAMAVRCSISQRPARAVREHIGLDMDDDFVPVGRKRRRIARFEHPLGHPRQRIGATHRARGASQERPTWDVGGGFAGIAFPLTGGGFTNTGSGRGTGGGCALSRRPTWDVLRRHALVVPPGRRLLRRMRGHRRIERTQDARAHLGREPPVQHHGAVVLVPEGEAAVLVLGIGPLGLLGALGPAIEPHELLHVLRGAVQADVEEVGFVLRSGDAGQRPALEYPSSPFASASESSGSSGQCPGDADLLARGVGVDAAGPGEPVGAGQRPLRGPDLAAVELGDEDEEPVRGGVDVGGEGGDSGGQGVVVHGGEIARESQLRNRH